MIVTGIDEFFKDTKFSHVKFNAEAFFEKSNFHGEADFSGDEFLGHTVFKSTFKELNIFDSMIFSGRVTFKDSNFYGIASFNRASFKDEADFSHSIFLKDTTCTSSKFYKEVFFVQTVFHILNLTIHISWIMLILTKLNLVTLSSLLIHSLGTKKKYFLKSMTFQK